MVILKKLQEFIGNKESSDVNRFGNKRRAHENHMVAFGQEIESIMSGKQTGSPSLSQKSLTKREQDTEEENPETQPVQQRQITFELGVEGNPDNPVLVPKVLCKRKSNPK